LSGTKNVLFVKKILNILRFLHRRLIISILQKRIKKSGTFRGEKYRFSVVKVPLFHPKSGTLLKGKW